MKGRDVVVDIPPGIEDGQRLRLHGQGIDPEVQGRQPGSLYVTVRVLEDPKFDRVGADIVTSVSLNLTEAIFGGEVKTTTLRRGYFESESKARNSTQRSRPVERERSTYSTRWFRHV